MKTMRYEYGSSIDDVEPTVKVYIKDLTSLHFKRKFAKLFDGVCFNFEFIWLIQM